jgi:hypothetical protein
MVLMYCKIEFRSRGSLARDSDTVPSVNPIINGPGKEYNLSM